MGFVKLVAFDRPLVAAVLPGHESARYTESELAEATEQAYRRGVDAARATADQQMVELRADIAQLSDHVLKPLAGTEAAVMAQLRDALPALALEIARRLLAGFEPDADTIARICREAVEQLAPERNGLQLVLCARDAALLQDLRPDWLALYPGLAIQADPKLQPGDCQVRSRFGLIDARQETKLAGLAHSFSGA